MKLRLCSSIFLFTLTTQTFANTYVGVFAGGGTSNNFNARQSGTAFFIEAAGGPLAVDAFGKMRYKGVGIFGAQLGYQAPDILLNPFSQWSFGTAIEMEAYFMNKRSYHGALINDTIRLPEHDFEVTYPMQNSVFLANAILSFNNTGLFVHPYLGLGIGNAILKITHADATQVNPAEAGVNHYNANTGDNVSTFAGQIKLGLNFDISEYVSIFVDYRWLYLANTQFVFGSTVFPGHAPTSPWLVNLDSQKYNLANVGVRFTW